MGPGNLGVGGGGGVCVCAGPLAPPTRPTPSAFQSHGQGREGYFPKPSSGTSAPFPSLTEETV